MYTVMIIQLGMAQRLVKYTNIFVFLTSYTPIEQDVEENSVLVGQSK